MIKTICKKSSCSVSMIFLSNLSRLNSFKDSRIYFFQLDLYTHQCNIEHYTCNRQDTNFLWRHSKNWLRTKFLIVNGAGCKFLQTFLIEACVSFQNLSSGLSSRDFIIWGIAITTELLSGVSLREPRISNIIS